MAGSFGDFLENELLDHVFANAAYTAPTTLFLALSTADPLDDASGLTEPSGGGYARTSVANNLTEWPAAAGGSKSNANPISFATATGSQGTVTHFAIMDALTLGNMLAHGDLTTPKTIDPGDTASFAAGDITITLD